MENMVRNNDKRKKAFTLIELVVVIAVIGILVLLATLRFLNYTKDAKLTQIINDVKVTEGILQIYLIKNNGILPPNGSSISGDDIKAEVVNDKVFNIKGLISNENDIVGNSFEILDKDFVKKKTNTKLKGDFIANEDGKVIYIHDKAIGDPDVVDESEDEIDALISQGYIPVASAKELQQINGSGKDEDDNIVFEELTWGAGTKWELKTTGTLSSKYVQVKDIDLDSYDNWTPIGDITDSFTGKFDGNGFKIRKLHIDKPNTDYQGLFGYTEGATLTNISLENVNVTGGSYTGGLVGYANESSTISNSYATGSVTGTGAYIGGLVGNARISSTISNSYATGSVSGGNYYTGGLVGRATESSISNSYATGLVTGIDYTGGLVGEANESTIENSYATGSVSGEYSTGGLVGVANKSSIENSYATSSVTGKDYTGGLVGGAYQSTKITNSYATGSVSGERYTGGLVGGASNPSISNSYWNTNTTGQTSSAGGGTGLTTSQMKQMSSYGGNWDFENTWQINEGQSYPYLKSNTQTPPPGTN